MKMGILAAIAVALVALYFVFGSGTFSPASTESVLSSETQDKSGNGLGQNKGSSKSNAANGDPSDEGHDEQSETNQGARPGNGELGSATAPPKSGLPMEVHRTPGAPTTYTRHDGVVIRDHRVNPTEPDLHAYTVLPPSASKVKPNTLIEVRQALRNPMQACIASNAAGAEEGAKLQLMLLTSIVSENLSIDKVSQKISGLPDSTALQSCVEGVALGHKQAVPGAQDVNIHRMVFNYPL